MIDDERGPLAQSDGSDGLLYDWFKHLTSLSLLTLGGVLGIVQGTASGEVKKSQLIVVVLLLVISGMSAFSGAATVVGARTTGTPIPNSVNLTLKIAVFSLCIGLGAFLYLFVGLM